MAVNSGAVRQWLRGGDLEKLQQLVLDGQGARLVGEYSPDARVRAFIRWLPSGLNKVDAAHAAAAAGQVSKLESALGAGRASQGGGAGARLPLAMCKDRAGAGLLHKAVFRGHRPVVDWLLDNHPNTVHLKDREGRTPLHYCGACEDPDAMWQRLVDAGADAGAKDNHGRTADYYLEKADELRLPTSPQHPAESRGRAADTALVVKPANIRIWIHDRDMGKLQQLLWEGHGARLRNETSKYPIVKRFLDGVPFVMGAVKDVHAAAIAGDLDTFQRRTEEPVPREILTSKDANGLTPLHKAAGLGHGHIVDDILGRAPGAVSLCDADGRTALHYAALVRDGGEVYNKLVRAGADELAQDNLGRSPEHYKNKPGDLDAALLRVVPDAPRTSAAYPPNWDWSVITDPTARVFNGRRSYENGDSESASSKDEDSGTNQSAATTVALDGTDLEPEPPPQPPPEPEPEPEPGDTEEGGGGDFRGRPPTPRPPPTFLGDDAGDDEDEGVGEDDDERDPREPGQMTDDELNAHIARGDLGVLADLVLNGEGDRLLSKNSSNPEVQSFLDHVPSYMSKIRAVHDAARAGNLRGLQAALDRRKFAVARDRRSQSACTPLHLAVLLGQTAVVRYLSGRFPETLSARDLRGRTALHYAAVLADNGHYYNLLLNLGANRALKDKSGRTADFYLQHPTTLTHRQLLADIGEPESIADEMFSDKVSGGGDRASSRRDVHDAEAMALMDRCFRLLHEVDAPQRVEAPTGAEGLPAPATTVPRHTVAYRDLREVPELPPERQDKPAGLNEIADKKPPDPVGYLANFLYNFTGSENAQEPEAPVMASVITNGEAQPVGNDDFGDDQRPDSQASDDGPKKSAFNDANRDEFGQSPLHFAAARPHGRGGLLQFMSEADLNPALRDELYRTARDVAVQAGLPDNVAEIDRWVLSVAARGQTDKLAEMLLAGYDHILDARESPEVGIVDVATQRGHTETVAFLQSITAFEERRDRVLRAIRLGGAQGAQEVAELLEPADSRAKLLATARNNMGRCSLHVAVLCQQEQLVAYLAHNFPSTLHVGDNLERTALHYAMGVEAVESLSKLLIKAGALRVPKDLKGRQPSYYFMNKTDIQHLQEEEEAQMF
ncbi:Putative ankyrin repeat protein, partial [Frankliniella fusca]